MKETHFRIYGPCQLKLWDGRAITEFGAWMDLLQKCGEKELHLTNMEKRIALLQDNGYYIVTVES